MPDLPRLSEFEQAMLLIAMTQTALLDVIAGSTEPDEADAVMERLNTDLAAQTPNIAKWLGKR